MQNSLQEFMANQGTAAQISIASLLLRSGTMIQQPAFGTPYWLFADTHS